MKSWQLPYTDSEFCTHTALFRAKSHPSFEGFPMVQLTDLRSLPRAQGCGYTGLDCRDQFVSAFIETGTTRDSDTGCLQRVPLPAFNISKQIIDQIPRLWRLKAQRFRLEGSACPSCGQLMFPPRPVCHHCTIELARPWGWPTSWRAYQPPLAEETRPYHSMAGQE